MRILPNPILLLGLLCLVLCTPAAMGQTGDVAIEVESFGIADHYRPGEFTGLRLALTAPSGAEFPQAVSAWVQWEVINADGDVAEYGRDIALTAGVPVRVWLYAPISPDTVAGDFWSVRLFEYEDGKRGRELASDRISAPGPGRTDIIDAMVGIVGTSHMGLAQLSLNRLAGGAAAPTGHENTRIVRGLQPRDLPDSWEGLRMFEVIAWSEELPNDLPTKQVNALREWIRRGGHFVISLPEDTNPWYLGEIGQSLFEDLLPTRRPRRDEDVRLETLMPILSKSAGVKPMANFALVAQVFDDVSDGTHTNDNGYEPVLALPDGRVIAVQRLFGHGRITVIGLDLSDGRLVDVQLSHGYSSPLPQADVFWNRVLGRRADTPTGSELTAVDRAERMTRSTPAERNIGTGSLFRQQINMSSTAGAGLAVALLLFAAYWIVAGPGGFYGLKAYGRVQHAWVAFAAAAGLFTAIAWGSVNLLRENDTRIEHLTVLDRIARPAGMPDPGPNDPQLERASSWMSLYVPRYGKTRVEIESMAGLGPVAAQRDLLASWTPPLESIPMFPNADRYVVDVRSPASIDLPARATATQLYANWMGALDADWGGLLYEDANDPVRVVRDAAGNPQLAGTVLNDLPGTLDDLLIVWVWNQRISARRYARDETGGEATWIRGTGQALNVGRMYATATQIVQDVPFRVPADVPGAILYDNIYQKYIKDFEGNTAITSTAMLDTERYLEMLSFFQQLTPPKYLRAPSENSPETVVVRRYLARELDLSPWLVRPCVIIIGYLRQSECPIPIKVNGRRPSSDGTTMVRWIVPLPIESAVAMPVEKKSR